MEYSQGFSISAYLNSFSHRYIDKRKNLAYPRVCRDLKSFSSRDCRDLSFKRALTASAEGIASHTSGNKSSKYEPMTGRKEITFSACRAKFSDGARRPGANYVFGKGQVYPNK